ncbi:hypothetical protein JB92DRAFT_2826158 [Gautieria morchelliformis]|nr:hypothetical protein JB92DRAFT_2826158 [Gautieria morchelliformis]
MYIAHNSCPYDFHRKPLATVIQPTTSPTQYALKGSSVQNGIQGTFGASEAQTGTNSLHMDLSKPARWACGSNRELLGASEMEWDGPDDGPAMPGLGLHTVPYIHSCTVPYYGHGTCTVKGLGDVPMARYTVCAKWVGRPPYKAVYYSTVLTSLQNPTLIEEEGPDEDGRPMKHGNLHRQQKGKRKQAKKIMQEEDKDEDDDKDGDFSDLSSGDKSSSESKSDIQSTSASSKAKSMTHAKKKLHKATVEEVKVEDSPRNAATCNHAASPDPPTPTETMT